MKFLSAVLLSLGTASASFVVDLSHNANTSPSEAPSEESEYPISEVPFFTTSTFDPNEQGNCNRPEIDTHGYVIFKLKKSFGEENCLDQEKFECALELDGFTASAIYTYKDNPVDRFTNPVPDSLEVYDALTNVGIAGAWWVDFFEECIDSVFPILESIELYRENPDLIPQAPSDGPMYISFDDAPIEAPVDDNSFISDAPSLEAPSSLYPSTFPLSVAPSGEFPSSFFPSSEVPSGPAFTSIAPDPTAAPSVACSDVEGLFEYNTKKKQKVKTLSCDKLAGFPRKKRNRFCTKDKVIREHCPTLCNRKACPCIDVKVEFPLSKRKREEMVIWTCDKLAAFNKQKRKRWCKNKRTIRKNCPTICDKKCKTSDE